MIPDKNFRLAKTTKAALSLMKGSKEMKNFWKRMMIDAQLHEESARRAALKTKEHDGRPSGKSRGAVAPE